MYQLNHVGKSLTFLKFITFNYTWVSGSVKVSSCLVLTSAIKSHPALSGVIRCHTMSSGVIQCFQTGGSSSTTLWRYTCISVSMYIGSLPGSPGPVGARIPGHGHTGTATGGASHIHAFITVKQGFGSKNYRFKQGLIRKYCRFKHGLISKDKIHRALGQFDWAWISKAYVFA